MFINLSNHPSAKWSEEQLKAALRYGDVVDLAFPEIQPDQSTAEVHALAETYISQIVGRGADVSVVHVMGEMTFTYHVVSRLKALGVKCVASTTERKPLTVELPDGTIIKKFKFVQFREY